MALTRKMLKAFGIEEDVIEQIIEAHVETTDSLKAERDRLKGEAEKVSELQGKVDDLQRQLEGAGSEELAELQAKYESTLGELADSQKETTKIRGEFDEYRGKVEAEETARAKQGAFRKLLVDSGFAPKYVDAIVRATAIDSIELGDDGEITDRATFAEKVKADWPEFVAVKETKGANPADPPQPASGPKGANPIAVQIAKERHERLYGKSEEQA